jgi:hypothetical protein
MLWHILHVGLQTDQPASGRAALPNDPVYPVKPETNMMAHNMMAQLARNHNMAHNMAQL